MLKEKPHLEFTKISSEDNWHTPKGYPTGIKQQILATDIDEVNKTGSRSRLLRFEPGVFTSEQFIHDQWEEVYLVTPLGTIQTAGDSLRQLCYQLLLLRGRRKNYRTFARKSWPRPPCVCVWGLIKHSILRRRSIMTQLMNLMKAYWTNFRRRWMKT